MSKPNETPPELCPEPHWHETHHYCPRCTWQNPDAPKSKEATLRARAEAAEAALAEAVGMLRSIRGMFDREGYPNVALDAYVAAHPAETPEGTGT